MESLRFLPALGRLLIAILFLPAGYGKLMAFTDTVGYAASAGMPVPQVAIALAIIVEVVGGILLLIGYQTRWVAAVMALFSVATALVFHSNFEDTDMKIHFMKNIAIAGGLLQIVYFGAGPFSVDSRRR
jgi:putative oxidoreductase